jgi:hypothetical protein
LFPYLTEQQAVKTYGEVEAQFHVFLSLALHREESHLQGTDALTPQKGTHRIGDRIATKAGLQNVEERKIVCP